MNKLNTKNANALDTLRDAFAQTWDALDAAVSAHTDADASEKPAARAVVDTALAAYVAAHTDLRAFCAEMREAMGEHFDSKSERWQEGPSGERYQSWMDAFEAVAESATPELDITEDGDVDLPEDITADVDCLSSEQD
jgi:hypothetical protein